MDSAFQGVAAPEEDDGMNATSYKGVEKVYVASADEPDANINTASAKQTLDSERKIDEQVPRNERRVVPISEGQYLKLSFIIKSFAKLH